MFRPLALINNTTGRTAQNYLLLNTHGFLAVYSSFCVREGKRATLPLQHNPSQAACADEPNNHATRFICSL